MAGVVIDFGDESGLAIRRSFKWMFCVQVVFLATLAVAFAAPQGPSTEPIPILRQEQEVNFDGTYKWRCVSFLQKLF